MKKLLPLIFLLPALAACPPLEEWEKLRGIEFYVENQSGEDVYIEYDGRAKTIKPTESFHARDSRSAYYELSFGREELKRFSSSSLCFFTIPIQKLRENWESNKGRFSDELLGIFTAYPVRIDSEYDERDGRQIYKWIFEVKDSWLAAGKASEDRKSMPTEMYGNVLVYMAADNDLYTAALNDINEMEAGWNASFTLYVFLDPPQNSPFNQPLIFRIVHDETDEIVSPVVKVFLQEIDSASKDGMVSVLSEAGFYFDKLILWSHSTGWLPENIDYRYALAYLYYEEKAFDKARKEVDVILEKSENYSQAVVLDALLKLERKDFLGAQAELEQNLISYPDDKFTKTSLAKVYLALDLFEKAKSIMTELIESEPENLAFLAEMCEICIGCKDYNTAIEYAEKMKNVNENYIEAYILGAKAAYEMKDLDKAKEYAQDAISLDMNCAAGYYYLALVRFDEADCDEAVECMKRAIMHDLNNPAYYAKMSEIYKVNGNLQAALEYIKEAESIDNSTEYKIMYSELVSLNRKSKKLNNI